MEGHAVTSGVGRYDTGSYWTDYPVVAAEVRRRATGDTTREFWEHFHDHVGGDDPSAR